MLPHRLDKPVITTTTKTYADILKQQFSLESKETTTDTAHNRPPRKRQATVLNYDSDQSEEKTAHAPNASGSPNTTVANPGNNQNGQNATAPRNAVDYAKELAMLKSELQSLRTLITTAVEQLKADIASTHAPTTNAIEMDADHSTTITPEISHLIADLKHDIATIAIEMRAKFNQQATLHMKPPPKYTTAT